MEEPTDWERQQTHNGTNLNTREQGREQAFRVGLPANTSNPTRTYSATASLAQVYEPTDWER